MRVDMYVWLVTVLCMYMDSADFVFPSFVLSSRVNGLFHLFDVIMASLSSRL